MFHKFVGCGDCSGTINFKKSTRRAQQEFRRGSEQRVGRSSRTIWLFQCINHRTSLCLRLPHLVVHCTKWNCPPACHPPTDTVQAVSKLRPKQTPRIADYLQPEQNVEILISIRCLTIFLLCPRILSSLSTASTWTKVLRVANCSPLSVHQSRALCQFTLKNVRSGFIIESGRPILKSF